MPQLDVVSFCNQVSWLSLFIVITYALFAYFITKPYNKVMQLQSYFIKTYTFSFIKAFSLNIGSKSFFFISKIIKDLASLCKSVSSFIYISTVIAAPLQKLISYFSASLGFINSSNKLFFYINKIKN